MENVALKKCINKFPPNYSTSSESAMQEELIYNMSDSLGGI